MIAISPKGTDTQLVHTWYKEAETSLIDQQVIASLTGRRGPRPEGGDRSWVVAGRAGRAAPGSGGHRPETEFRKSESRE